MMNYEIRVVKAMNTLGMEISVYEILEDGTTVAECRSQEYAEKIVVALMRLRDEVNA